MKQCKFYEDAFCSDCCVCDEDCKYRKTGNLLSSTLVLSLIVLLAIMLIIL